MRIFVNLILTGLFAANLTGCSNENVPQPAEGAKEPSPNEQGDHIEASGESVPLPSHSVEETSLNNRGYRIQVTVTHDITKAECEALIDKYRDRAGPPDGQVSVHKPNKFNGDPAPWCVDNFEGEISYNEGLF